MGIVTIAIAEPVKAKVSRVATAQGTICMDDWTSLFWCRSQGMADRTSDKVSIEVGEEMFADNEVSDQWSNVHFFDDYAGEKEEKSEEFLQ